MTSVLLINEPPLQVLPSLAVAIGLNEAIILQQIHYWLNPRFNQNYFDNRYWVYNTYEQWQQQFPFWCQKTIQRAIANLEKAKLLISFTTKDFKKKKHYSIDYNYLNQLSSSEVKTSEYKGSRPSGQFVPIDLDINDSPSGQIVPIDRVNLTRSHITENTQENTLLLQEEEEKKNISGVMIGIWNEHVQSKLKLPAISHLTPKRQQSLTAILSEMFKQDLQAWEAYCQQIANCRFLMGENPNAFRASLDWALNSDNACKVLEWVFYDKPISNSKISSESSSEEFLSALKQNTKDHPYQAIWVSISKLLADKLGQSVYTAWFTKLKVADIANNVLTFAVDSAFTKDYIGSHYQKALEEAVRIVDSEITQLRFQVAPSKGAIN